jgi:ATP-dependent RNA helicase DDX19/DBP5
MDVLKEMGKYTKVTSMLAVPNQLDKGVRSVKDNIIIGTPGTIVQWIEKRIINIRTVKLLVLDEADNLLDAQGLSDTCIKIKNKLPKSTQIALFSATFSEAVYRYATRFCPNANEITLRREELNVQAIRQYYFECKNDNEKYEAISKLYKVLNIGSSIIFVAQRRTAEILFKKMKADGHELAFLHGQMETEERDKAMDEFRSGKTRVIISTNVISRGIDISDVTLVINYDMPMTRSGSFDPETYLHRVGRTGRFGRKGVSINLIHDAHSRKVMNQIEDHLSIKIEKLPNDDWEKLEKILKL